MGGQIAQNSVHVVCTQKSDFNKQKTIRSNKNQIFGNACK